MGRNSLHEAQKTRSRIIEVAEKLFLEEGLACSLQKIAAKAGVTRGAIYGHFTCRSSLLRCVISRQEGDWGKSYTDIEMDICSNPLTNILALARQPLTQACADSRLQNIVRSSTRLAPCSSDAMSRYTACLKREWLRAVSLGLTREDVDIDVATTGLIALTNGLIKHWVDSQQKFDLLALGVSAIQAYLEGWLPNPIKSKVALRLAQQFILDDL